LKLALISHASSHEIARMTPNPYGMKYIIEGELQTPDHEYPHIRAIWIIENEQELARFVTAYPL
jgi:hypothetical protein